MTDKYSDAVTESMESGADVLRRHLRRVEAELERAEAYGEDDYPDETVLLFRYRFHHATADDTYAYVALKKGRSWWLTGERHSRRSWTELVEFWLAGEVTELWVVSEYERVL